MGLSQLTNLGSSCLRVVMVGVLLFVRLMIMWLLPRLMLRLMLCLVSLRVLLCVLVLMLVRPYTVDVAYKP